MKTIEDILELNDKETVTAVAGVIVSIEAPREPSQAQAAKGIHVQNFRIASSKGATLQCQFLSAAMHIDDSVRGQLIILKSADTERGPYGLQINIYNGNLSLVVSKQASYSLKDPPQAKGSDASQQAAPEAKALAPSTLGRAYASGSIPKATKAYVQIYREMIAALGQEIPFTECFPAITTIFIAGDKGGWVYAQEETAPKIDAIAPMARAEKTLPAPDSSQVLKHLVSDALNGSISNRAEQADRALKMSGNLTWDNVYDGLLAYLALELQLTAQELLPLADHVFDTTRLNLGPSGATVDVARAIALDFESFRQQVVQYASRPKAAQIAPPQTETEPETINPYTDIPV